MPLLFLLACAPLPAPLDPPGDTASDAPLRLADLPALAFTERATVGTLLVATPRSRDGTVSYVVDAETGAGLEVRHGDALTGWPPAVGTPVTLTLTWVGSEALPAAWLVGLGDVVVEGPPVAVPIAEAPVDPPVFSLATWPEVTITSDPEPTHRADLSIGRRLDGRFAAPLPTRGNTGALTGLVLADGAVAPRTPEDWAGPTAPIQIFEGTIAEVLDGVWPEGASVRIDGTQASPWSRDGRFLVLQDAAGRGLWVDAEGFGQRVTMPRATGLWTVQPRREGDRWRARMWRLPEIGEPRLLVVQTGSEAAPLPPEGTLVVWTVTGLGPPDAYGERVDASGLVLDDRFVDLSTLSADATVRGAVDGLRTIAVTRVIAER